jgi:hypothetical protein
MIHPPFSSLEAMLSVETMSALEGRAVTRVESEQWQPAGPGAASGCEFLKVRSYASSESRPYFVKSSAYRTDMVRRLTDDHACRERLVWQHGVLDRLPAEIDSPTVAHACDGEGWALLMLDASVSLNKLERRRAGEWNVLTWPQVSTIVDALASLHARFYRDPVLCDPALGLCTAYQMYAWLRPAMMEREATSAPRFIDMQRTGWTLLDRLEAPDVATGLAKLHADPTRLVKALARYPSTLVHGDPKRENLGLTDDPTPRLVLIDWQFAAALPPTVDLAWMLWACEPTAVSKERLIDCYHEQLVRRLGSRFDERTWEPQLRLALLGQAVRIIGFGLWAAHHQNVDPLLRDLFGGELPWWCEQARAGLNWL